MYLYIKFERLLHVFLERTKATPLYCFPVETLIKTNSTLGCSCSTLVIVVGIRSQSHTIEYSKKMAHKDEICEEMFEKS